MRQTDAQGLTRPYNTVYAVKYRFFARILALCRARIITIPTIHSGLQNHSLYRMKTIVIIVHLCSEMAVFADFSPTSLIDRSDTQDEYTQFNSN
jgi:hypothetical protein